MAIDNLSSRDAGQRANALETLEGAGEPDLVRPLLAVWDASRPRGDDTVSATGEMLGDEDPWLRACAALAANALSDRHLASELLDRARSDPDPLVRDAATQRGGGVETLSTLSLLERILFLRNVPLFADLSPADLKHIAEAASEHVYPDGEVIAQQGEAGDEMHIVVEGEIRVMVDADGEPARELARRTKGENVGEMALLTGESRMASLVCSGSVRTLSLDRRRFERILRERPDVGLAVMRVLSDRLRESHSRGRSLESR
jgi:cyclic nucleotide-binding protein